MSNISSIGLRIGHVVRLLYSGCISALPTEDAVTHNLRMGSDKVSANVKFTFTFAMLSLVRLSVVCLSVTLVHSTQAVEIVGNISTAIIFTYTVRLQQFFGKNVAEKVGNQNLLYFPTTSN